MALARESYITGQKMNISYILILCSMTFARQFCFVLFIVIIFFSSILHLARETKLFVLKKLKKEGSGRANSQECQYPRFCSLALKPCPLQVGHPYLCTEGCFTLLFLQMSHLSSALPLGISRARL